MRLIDADKLIELIDDDISGLNSDYISVISQTAYDVALCTFTMVKQHIDALPTAEPTKHGYWKWNKQYGTECSECGTAMFEVIGHIFSSATPKYCPYCGAKMDEVEE